MSDLPHISVLGGGPAGLAVGYYAQKRGVPCTLFEAADRVGGNCVTHRVGGFRYDSGAHRLHDRDPEITGEIQTLLGDELRIIDVPSQIFDAGRLIRFPLSPAQLLRHLGVVTFARAGLEVLQQRMQAGETDHNLESFVLGKYGRTIASRFLLNYSEKLWGAPPAELSPAVAGKRLSGLDLRTFIAESLFGRDSGRHVEGRFFYPRKGIGAIADALAAACGPDTIRTNAPVTGLVHDAGRIHEIEIDGRHRHRVNRVVSSLPLPLTLRMLSPKPPSRVLELADTIRYRQVRLVVLMIDRESVTDAATVYFPDSSFEFTRISEPRNRSPEMAPDGQTSLLVEIPCHLSDEVFEADDETLIRLVRDRVVDIGWVRREEILDATTTTMRNAYPVLDTRCDEAVAGINEYLGRFRNLSLTGRSGRFVYGWIHDMMRFGLETVAEVADEVSSR